MFRFQKLQGGQSDDTPIELVSIPGVLSQKSVDMMLSWVYELRPSTSRDSSVTTQLSECKELARLADYWLIPDF
jgi:hypothetical protein